MSIIGGITNITLDYIFIVKLNMGIAGAGLGTFLGCITSVLIAIYFFTGNRSKFVIRLQSIDWSFMKNTIFNGSSEMVNEIALAFSTFIFNILTLKYFGNSGVAAISVILYVNFLFSSIFIGFASGVAPLLSYHYGAQNIEVLKKITKYTKKTLLVISPTIFIITIVSTPLLTGIFLPKTDQAYELATQGLYIFTFAFLFSGLNMYGSSFFTALSNGKISAMISFGKTFIFFSIFAFLLPLYVGVDGIWMIMPFTEALTSIVVILLMKKKSPLLSL